MLSTFMVDDSPDYYRFMKVAGDIFKTGAKRLGSAHNSVAICSECAHILWSQGNSRAAIRLEQLWDDFAISRNVHLLCGYPRHSFEDESGRHVFNDICAQHSTVYLR